MKKTLLMLILTASFSIVLTVTGCKKDSDASSPDGIFKFKNKTNDTLYVNIAAINTDYDDTKDSFANGKYYKEDVKLKPDEEFSWDFYYSKFVDTEKNRNVIGITVSQGTRNEGKAFWSWPLDKRDCFLVETNIAISKKDNAYHIAKTATGYTHHEDLNNVDANKSITVINKTGFYIVCGIVGYTDENKDVLDHPEAITNKKFISNTSNNNTQKFNFRKSDLNDYNWVGVSYWNPNKYGDVKSKTSYNYIKFFYGEGMEDFDEMIISYNEKKDSFEIITK